MAAAWPSIAPWPRGARYPRARPSPSSSPPPHGPAVGVRLKYLDIWQISRYLSLTPKTGLRPALPRMSGRRTTERGHGGGQVSGEVGVACPRLFQAAAPRPHPLHIPPHGPGHGSQGVPGQVAGDM